MSNSDRRPSICRRTAPTRCYAPRPSPPPYRRLPAPPPGERFALLGPPLAEATVGRSRPPAESRPAGLAADPGPPADLRRELVPVSLRAGDVSDDGQSPRPAASPLRD